jgi:hypothetical protein
MFDTLAALELKVLEGAIAYAYRLPDDTDKKESVLFFLGRIGEVARQDQRWSISLLAKRLIVEINKVGSVNLVRKRLATHLSETNPDPKTPDCNTGVTPSRFETLEEYI